MPLSAFTQEELRELWKGGQSDRLCAFEVAKAWALREASREIHQGEDTLPWVAARVVKNDGTHPSKQALFQLFNCIDSDPDWFPGKHNSKRRGPQPIFSSAKRQRCAAAMMQLKHDEGEEPSLEDMRHRCPGSVTNPQTGLPFSDGVLRRVLNEDCYDVDPEHPWRFQARLRKRFLSEKVMEQRLKMSKALLGAEFEHCTPGWYYQNVVWMDPCASILPGSKAQWLNMKQLLKGPKGYLSDNAKMNSMNLSGPETALKQKTFVGRKQNWVILLARGQVGVFVLRPGWQLNGEGMAEVVDNMEGWLRQMLGGEARLPRVLFTDRGTGMYSPGGKIVRCYEKALKRGGWRPFFGSDAGLQAPDMGDMLLHETGVSWVRNRLRRLKTRCLPWEETSVQWANRMQTAVKYVNVTYKVRDLCHSFPKRVQKCVALCGDRLKS